MPSLPRCLACSQENCAFKACACSCHKDGDEPEVKGLDSDLETMNRAGLLAEVKKLRAGIRTHRDATGHNLCWFVPELWSLLPERVEPTPEVPAQDEFLRCCATYRQTLNKP